MTYARVMLVTSRVRHTREPAVYAPPYSEVHPARERHTVYEETEYSLLRGYKNNFGIDSRHLPVHVPPYRLGLTMSATPVIFVTPAFQSVETTPPRKFHTPGLC